MSRLTARDIAWAAGLLEGEGCFHFGSHEHSKYLAERISISMTDADVIAKLADIWGSSKSGPIGRTGKDGISGKPVYRTGITGWKAVQWAMTIYVFMGTRRRSKIRELIDNWKARPLHPSWGIHTGRAKLKPETIREIRRLYKSGETKRGIARKIGTSATNIRIILQGKTWSYVD